MSVKKILYVTPNYPVPQFPERGAFVEALVRGWKKSGVETDVVAPVSLRLVMSGYFSHKQELTLSAKTIKRPFYISMSNKKLGFLDTKVITDLSFSRACDRASRDTNADVVVGKFLLSGARAAIELGKKYNKPVFADIGESRTFKHITAREKRVARAVVESLAGIYCVSERLAEEVVSLGADCSKVLVVPNEADTELFKPMDQSSCREKLGIPPEDYVVVFVGHLIERKGPMRLSEAIEALDENYKVIFIGRGKQVPSGDHVLHVGPVQNSELSVWLNAADVFCLPTLGEGHCNAVEEAKACGLPVVASNIPSVAAQLEDWPAILVDPASVKEISNGLLLSRANFKKTKLLASSSDRNQRSKKILDWMELLI